MFQRFTYEGNDTIIVDDELDGRQSLDNSPLLLDGLVHFYAQQYPNDPNKVAKNLYLAFSFIAQRCQCVGCTISSSMKRCLREIPEYRPYHETVQMLVLFS
jgi:hypothetical protein